MTIGIDSVGSHSFAANQSIVPVGTIKGVLILIVDNGGTSDTVTGITINGVSMTEVALSPLVWTASLEDAVLYGYFMGSSIPTGTLDVDYSGTVTESRQYYVAFTADGDTDDIDTTTATSTSGTGTTVTVNGDADGTWGVAIGQFGYGTASQLTPISGMTEIFEDDFGAQLGAMVRNTTRHDSASGLTIGWTASGGSTSYAILGVSVAETGAPVTGTSRSYGHGRSTAVRSAATTQATIQTRAKGHSTAVGNTPAVEADASSRGKAWSSVAASQQITVAVRARGKGRSTAARAAFTHTVAAHGRGRGRARSSATTFAGAIPGAGSSRGHGYSSAFGDQSGTQNVIANSTDFLEMMMPLSPAAYVEAQLVRGRKPTSILQGVSHLFTLSGNSATPIVGQWSAEDDAFGGFGTAVGVISYKDAQKYRGVLQEGAAWRTYDSATGECIWGGRIREIDRQRGGAIAITGRGWGQTIGDRVLQRPTVYAIYGTEGWVDATGEIGNFGDDDFGGSGTANGGSLIYKWGRDPDRTSEETLIMVFEKPGATFSRIQFYVEAARDGTTDTGFDLFVYAGRTERFDDIGDLQTVYGQEEIIIPDDINTRYDIDFDVPLDQDNSLNGGPGDQLDYREPWDLVAISITHTTTGITNGLKVKIQDVKLLGEALQTNELSAGQLVADLMADKGLRTTYIDNAPPDILPYTVEAGTPLSEPLQFAALLARKRFVIRGERPVPIFSSPSERRWWVYGEHHEVDLVPGERYDTILVPYTLGTTEHIYGFRKVQLNPTPLIRHNNFGALDWPVPIRVRQTEFSPSGIDDQAAEELGYAILRQLVRPRRSGQGSLTEIVDAAGIRHSARMLQAGDQLRYVHGEFSGWLHVSKVTHFDDRVDVEFDDPISKFLERMTAKRELKRAKRGRGV